MEKKFTHFLIFSCLFVSLYPQRSLTLFLPGVVTWYTMRGQNWKNRTRGVGRGAKIGRPISLDFFTIQNRTSYIWSMRWNGTKPPKNLTSLMDVPLKKRTIHSQGAILLSFCNKNWFNLSGQLSSLCSSANLVKFPYAWKLKSIKKLLENPISQKKKWLYSNKWV